MRGNTYPIYESLPEDIERRRLEVVEKTSVTRSPVVMWPVAAEVIQAEPIVADAVPSGSPQRRQLRRGGRRIVRRMRPSATAGMGSTGGFNFRHGFQGNH